MSDGLRAYIERDPHLAMLDMKWHWYARDTAVTLIRGRTMTRFGARIAARRALRHIRRARSTPREEIR